MTTAARDDHDARGCPPWCHEHQRGVSARDEQHQGRLVSVPVVERVIQDCDGEDVVPARVATTFDIVRHQDGEDPTEWVFVGDDDIQLDLTLDSARTLLRALEDAVGV